MATRLAPEPPRRSAPFEQEPGFYPDAGLWMYGNVRLLGATLAFFPLASGHPYHTPTDLDQVEREAEQAVLAGSVLVTGIHSPAHQRAAIVPLRWGAPRILVLSGGFHYHLGKDLKEEPFRAARLWRYQFDERTDLVIYRRAPDKLPTFARFNPTVDRLIERIANRNIPGLIFRP
jgi:DNA processing protein